MMKPKVGDRIKFRALTRYAGAPLLNRKVKEVLEDGSVYVRCHGFGKFHVKAREIEEVIRDPIGKGYGE
ncbi:MAG: hypothetical protein ACYTEQ_01675 [Planctomycetota bacterium]|jgi:hypothetical protein